MRSSGSPPAASIRVKLLPLQCAAGEDPQVLRANRKKCAQLWKKKTGQEIGRLDNK